MLTKNKKLFKIPEDIFEGHHALESLIYLAYGENDFETSKIIMNWMFEYFDRWIPAINEPILSFLKNSGIFRYELPYNFVLKMGNCGLVTTIFNLFCHLSGIKSRRVSIWSKVFADSTQPAAHTLGEIFYEGNWHIFDPSTNVYFLASMEEIVSKPKLFFETICDEFVDTGKWEKYRLWAMCNDRLYSNVTSIEYQYVKPIPGRFEYEGESVAVKFDRT